MRRCGVLLRKRRNELAKKEYFTDFRDPVSAKQHHPIGLTVPNPYVTPGSHSWNPHGAKKGLKSLVRETRLKWMPQELKQWVDFPKPLAEQEAMMGRGNHLHYVPKGWRTGEGHTRMNQLIRIVDRDALEAEVLKILRPIVDNATEATGRYVLDEKNLRHFVFRSPELSQMILEGIEKEFYIRIPLKARREIDSVELALQWLVQRINLGRPDPDYTIPQGCEEFIEGFLSVQRALDSHLESVRKSSPPRWAAKSNYDWERWQLRAESKRDTYEALYQLNQEKETKRLAKQAKFLQQITDAEAEYREAIKLAREKWRQTKAERQQLEAARNVQLIEEDNKIRQQLNEVLQELADAGKLEGLPFVPLPASGDATSVELTGEEGLELDEDTSANAEEKLELSKESESKADEDGTNDDGTKDDDGVLAAAASSFESPFEADTSREALKKIGMHRIERILDRAQKQEDWLKDDLSSGDAQTTDRAQIMIDALRRYLHSDDATAARENTKGAEISQGEADRVLEAGVFAAPATPEDAGTGTATLEGQISRMKKKSEEAAGKESNTHQ